MTLLRFEPRRRRGRSCEGCPDMVGADEDENRIWDIGRKIKIKIKMKMKMKIKMKEATGCRLQVGPDL